MPLLNKAPIASPIGLLAESAKGPRLTRREWLLAATLLLVGGPVVRGRATAASNAAGLPIVDRADPLKFFRPDEARFIDAAISRLIPDDALGPGANEAGVAVFIDHQLAGPFGQASDWYMAGPWADGAKQQGYQCRRTPAEVYRAAIGGIDDHVRQASGNTFAMLAGSEQDRLLHALAEDKIDLGDVSASTFFTLLWQNTQEGFFADPIYFGNRGFAGWKLVGYPGPRYNYDGAIRHFGERYPLPTVGLMGRDPSKRPSSL
ncbi:MAG: gluconate 2-dehydrogenase subunit 3 family protein [Casimicrobiaceae bacterium]